MKILMVNKFLFAKGGCEIYMEKLGKYLTEMGHTVEYFGMQDEKNTMSNSVGEYVSAVDYHSKGFVNPLNTIYSKTAAKAMNRVIESFKPDIVHIHNVNFQLTMSVVDEAKKHGIPVIQTVHDSQITCPAHRLFIESTNEICTRCYDGNYKHCIDNKCVHNSKIKSILAAMESNYNHKKGKYQKIDKFICPSEFFADVIKQGGIDESKIITKCNFCDAPENNDYPKEKYIIYFGRLSAEKGTTLLADVMKELTDITFLVAGTGDMEDKVKNIKNVKYVGYKSGDELKKLIGCAKASISTSLWYENCPLSVIESMELGTPVIAPRLGGIPELVEDGKTGILYECGNKEDLKNKILSLWGNEGEIESMTSYCKEKEYCTIDKYYKDIIKVYENLIKK